MTERIFLAVALDDEVRHGLVAFLGENIETGSFPGKPVRPENWHVTLRFRGETTATQLERVLAFLDAHRVVSSFPVSFAGLGAFPKVSRATVLWLGIDRGGEELARVAAVCEEAAVTAGFEPEDRPFHPHVTLARVRPQQDVRDLVGHVPRFPLTQRVEAVTVYRSSLGPAGATYEVVATVPLA